MHVQTRTAAEKRSWGQNVMETFIFNFQATLSRSNLDFAGVQIEALGNPEEKKYSIGELKNNGTIKIETRHKKAFWSGLIFCKPVISFNPQ